MWGEYGGVRIRGQATPQDPRWFQKAKPAGLHSAPLGPDAWRRIPNSPSLELGHAPAFPGLTLPRPDLATLCPGVETPCLDNHLYSQWLTFRLLSDIVALALVHSWPGPSAFSRHGPRHQIECWYASDTAPSLAESSPLHGRPHLSHLQHGQEGAPEDKLWFVHFCLFLSWPCSKPRSSTERSASMDRVVGMRCIAAWQPHAPRPPNHNNPSNHRQGHLLTWLCTCSS